MSKVDEVWDAVIARLQTVSSQLDNPTILRSPPEIAQWGMPLPVLLIAPASLACSRLTNKTIIYESLDFLIDYYYEQFSPQSRIDKVWDAGDVIVQALQEDPSLGGIVVGIDGLIRVSPAVVELGQTERFLTGVRVTVTYTLTPFEK